MSDKNNNANSNPSTGDEFLKKNLPTNKKCPRCGRVYTDENILFCYYDGVKLILTNQQQVPQQVQHQRLGQLSGEFSGFELNLQNTSHNVQIPIEIIQSTTRLLQPNSKIPTSSENVKSLFWSIPTPKKNRNIFFKLLSNVGWSRSNLYSYLICYILILITYGFWITKANPTFLQDLTTYNPNYMAQIALLSIYTLAVLILPILSLGYTESDSLQASRNDFFLRIEPTLFLMILGLNYLIINLGGAIPILIIPGEPKVKVNPPVEYVVKSVKRSMYPSLLLFIVAFIGILFLNYAPLGLSSFTQTNIIILAYFVSSILLLETIPFGNTIGKILLKHRPRTFYISFLLIMTLMTYLLSITTPF